MRRIAKPKVTRKSSRAGRQSVRRELFENAMADVNAANLKRVGESHSIGMLRKERRKLAAAYAKGAWKEQRAAKAAA